jgi:hypothetical protein
VAWPQSAISTVGVKYRIAYSALPAAFHVNAVSLRFTSAATCCIMGRVAGSSGRANGPRQVSPVSPPPHTITPAALPANGSLVKASTT